jgi:Hypothetical glycosyl hydrolase family 15
MPLTVSDVTGNEKRILMRDLLTAGRRRLAVALRAAASALLLLCAALPLPAAGAASGSTKFIPTFAVYYGGGPPLVAADAAKLAKFDLIDIDRFRYHEMSPNTWAAIKSINPNVQIYLYEMGSEAPSHLDGTPELYLNGLGRYNVSRGHPMGSLNGEHPGLFLLDSSGNRIYNAGFSNPAANQFWHLMDFGAAAYQSYWATAVKADIVDQPWAADGIFADNCTALNFGPYTAVPAKYPNTAAWNVAMNSFASAITAELHAVGQKVWCNRSETRWLEGSAAWRALDDSANPPDVLLEEGAFAVKWGGGTEFPAEPQWRRSVDTMSAIRNSKVAVMSHTQLAEGEAGTDSWGKPVTFWQTLWYSLGSFLLTKNDDLGNAYFMFRGAGDYSKIWWFDEYDKIDLGKAVKTRIEQTSSSIHNTAGWITDGGSRAWSGGSAEYSMVPGARAEFTFTGTSISWIGARGPQTGIARVWLDGALVAEVDTYRPSEEIQANVYSVAGLAPGSHTLTIEVTGRKNAAATFGYIVLDAFDVNTNYNVTTAETANGPVNVYWREFEGGYVYVNPTPNDVETLTLPQASRQVTHDNLNSPRDSIPSVTAISLSGHHAAILLKTVARFEQTSPSFTATAGWVHDSSSRSWSGGSAVHSTAAGTQATFTFTGTSVGWIGARGPQTGIARVWLDGALVAEVDTYRTSEEIQANVYSATGLAAGNHTLMIEVTGRKNAAATDTYIVVDAFDVAP